MAVKDQLTEVFREVFEDDEITISRDTTADDIDAWDSLSHMNLIMAVETRFGIRFRNDEIMRFKDVGDLMDSIESKL